MVKPIKIRNVQDIQNINNIVSKYPFDIWIHGKSGMADAKSILGMFLMKLDEPLTLVVPDNVEYDKLFNELEDYIQFY
jgi:hypothetical protein